MLYWKGDTTYQGTSVIELVRAMENAANSDSKRGGTVAQFLEWSLAQLEEPISLGELALGRQVDDETLALSYLLLLEQHGHGELRTTPNSE